ncbi:MAG: PaaI family thioesterase [Candidatus Hermodarchaeia archaeon]
MHIDPSSNEKAFQDYYPDELSHCYGCGRLNDHGLKIKSYWDGEETVAVYQPNPYHTSIPGYVYGGLIASLIDCHTTGTASAAASREAGVDPSNDPNFRYVTASLQVDFLRPTPMGVPLEVRGVIEEIKDRKVVVNTTVSAQGKVCARSRGVTVKMPKNLWPTGDWT